MLLARYYGWTLDAIGRLTIQQMRSALNHIAEIEGIFNGQTTPTHSTGPREALQAAKSLSHMGKMKRPQGM